jgi:DNA-binding response OmpR family regulator
MATPLLLVEDDDGIAAPLTRALTREGYEVRRAATGADALSEIGQWRPMVVILDLGLPDVDGLEVCRQVRKAGVTAPILILTARGDELDRVVGLDSGADDYMAKPVALAELLARVRALMRRPGMVQGTPVEPSSEGAGVGLRVDEAAHRVWVHGRELHLTGKEFGVLALLAREPGNVLTRERLMEEVWDEHWFGSTKTLDVTIGRLRSKLEDLGAPVRVVAVRGVGFRLEGDA